MPLKVEVIRSPRRRKTVQAREVNGVLRVSIPATMSTADEAEWVAEMLRRVERRASTRRVDLDRRAGTLAARYGLPLPTVIRWSDNQEWRWGSCTPAEGSIRISSRLIGEPAWVLDYVIVHELAHLVVPRHNQRFWALVNRYPLAERARGFLMARGASADTDSSPNGNGPGGQEQEPPRGAWPRPQPRGRRPAKARGNGSVEPNVLPL